MVGLFQPLPGVLQLHKFMAMGFLELLFLLFSHLYLLLPRPEIGTIDQLGFHRLQFRVFENSLKSFLG